MTEQEWLEVCSPAQLLHAPNWYPSARKGRLFLCACGRRKWKWLSDHRLRRAIEISESFADDEDRIGDLDRASQEVRLSFHESRSRSGMRNDLTRACAVVLTVTRKRRLPVREVSFGLAGLPRSKTSERLREEPHQAALYRDIFGNPFRPVVFDPKWRTEYTVGLALKMYDEREFAAMPILADALEEVGCDNPDILTHCREPGVHVRGCWVVDLVLGKE